MKHRLKNVRRKGHGSAALRAYAAEITPFSWSAEEDQTFIRTHKEGKTFKKITAMLPGRTERAVRGRWDLAKNGKAGTTALRAYAAECATA